MAILVAVALIAAHVALLGLVFRGHSLLAVVGAVVGLVVVKFGWRKVRRSRGRPGHSTG
jgi:hypothetical protein